MSGSGRLSPIQSIDKKENNNSDAEISFGDFADFSSSSKSDNPIESIPNSSGSHISNISGKGKSFDSQKSASSKKSNKQDTQKSNTSTQKSKNEPKDDLSDVVDLSLDDDQKSNISFSGSFLNSTKSATQSKTKTSTQNIETIDSTFSTNQTSKQDTKTDLLKTSTLTKTEAKTLNPSSSQLNTLQTTNSTTSQIKTEISKSSTKTSGTNSKMSTKTKASEKQIFDQLTHDDDEQPQLQHSEPKPKERPSIQPQEHYQQEKPKQFDNPLYPRKSWYEQEPEDKKLQNENEKDIEIERLTNLVRDQRTIINNQKETIRLLMSESVKHEEISSLRAALASKSPLLQLVAATPMSEQRATKQLRAENEALRREIDEIEMRHLNELKAMRAQFAMLSSRTMPTDGCAQCKRRIRELENQLKQYQNA